ncbi:MAG TPA: hypothetical protein VIY28_19665 [Pseudonocardiaceae bacterium]
MVELSTIGITHGERRLFERWASSNLALGLAFNSFLPVLLPSYVLSAGGSTTDVAVAMAMAGLCALIGPSISALAVRYGAYRLPQVLGVLGMAVGLMVLALSAGESVLIVLGIAVMGIGAAAVTVSAPACSMGTDQPMNVQARRLASLQLNLDLGKIAGGLILGGMASAKLALNTQFWVGALVIGVLGLLVWGTSRSATAQIRPLERDLAAVEPSRTVPLKTLLLSLFGVPLLAQLLGSATMMEAQISTMLTMSGLVGVGLHFLAGRWMPKSGPGVVWATGNALRGAGGVALGAVGLVLGMPYLVALAAFLLLESTPAVVWMTHARAAPQITPVATGVARTSRGSLPTGQQDQRTSRNVEVIGVRCETASPSAQYEDTRTGAHRRGSPW